MKSMVFFFSILFLSFSFKLEAKILINFDPEMDHNLYIQGDSNLNYYRDWVLIDNLNFSLLDKPRNNTRCLLTLIKNKKLDQMTLQLYKRANQNQPISFVAEFINPAYSKRESMPHPYARLEIQNWLVKKIESVYSNGSKNKESIRLEPIDNSTFKMTTWESNGKKFVVSGHETLQCYEKNNNKKK